MISIRDLSLSYGKRSVLRGCTLEVPAGERIALMGPSGCGKTSLLRCLLGLQRPTSGSAQLHGKAACLFQEPRLLPKRTAAENVNAVLSDTPATLPLAKEWLARVGLSDAADLYPAELSGGMQQRVAIARALAYGGDVLALDEPLKGLDAALREEMLSLLRTYCEGRTVLLITHDAAEAEALGAAIWHLKDGRVYPAET